MPEHESPTHIRLLSADLDKPFLFDALCQELKQLVATGQYQSCFNRALELVRDYPKVEFFRLQLALSAKALKQYDLAVAALTIILKNNPEHLEALIELGMIYHQLDKFDEALAMLEHAFSIDSNNILLAQNLSIIYYEYGRLDLAMAYYQKITVLDPQKQVQYTPALIHLAEGDYSHGWDFYEYRLQKQGSHLSPIALPTPKWQRNIDLTDKTLVVLWEQGYGDNIQFSRFLLDLKKYKPKVIYFLCQKDIAPLFQSLEGISILGVNFLGNIEIPKHDYHLYIASLPYLLAINNESQFWSSAYLHVNTEKKALWEPRIAKTNHLKIGLCWEGNTQHPFNDKRSCELGQFIKLLAYYPIDWYSLQHVVSPEEIELLHYAHIHNLGSQCHDFADTAAAIAELDLIISVDTAIAHLAGAMAKPVWLLLRYQTEWRHPRNRETSPWYPSMRLIRQHKPGDWDSVFQQIETLLAAQYSLSKLKGV